MRPKVKLALLLVAVTGLFAAALLLPIGRPLLRLVEYVRDAGAVGFGLYLGVYVVATVLLVPGSVLTLGAGFAYGVIGGVALVFPGAMLGATFAFILGRTLARDWIAERVKSSPRFDVIDRAIGSEGFKVVLLLRLSPVVPFSLLNYSLGLTRVRLRDYVAASAIGMVPGIVLYVYLGSLITSAAQLTERGAMPDGGVARQLLFWGGLVATLVVTVWITRVARRALRQELDR